MRTLSKKDIWALINGAAAFATGGGGSAQTYEQFSAVADPILSKHTPKLIEPKELKDNDAVFMDVGCGGGITREYQEKYMRYDPPQGWYKMINIFSPLNSWSEKVDTRASELHLKRLEELVGKKPAAYEAFELGPLDSGQILNAAARNLPLVDADCAGSRAVPELSLTKLNVINVPIAPYTIATAWGDLIVGEKILSHQRWEDISRAIANMSGGGCAPAMSITGKNVKDGTEHGTMSLAIKVGEAILKAKESGDDPVDAIVKQSKGYKIFEGKIAGFTTERKGAFIWGSAWIEGTGDYNGKTFRLWYQNENQISWVDEKPYVTCPDPFTVIESETGLGLSNFRPEWWVTGKKVAVTAIKACSFWRTPRGLQIYNPKHFGFDIDYVPIEKKVK